jgi:lipoyl(octanoyl) transferase
VLASDALLAARGVTLHEINRGGDVTYHGPGQLVGYPIFDLRSMRNPSGARMGPVDFVRRMEEALIRVCGTFGLRAGRTPGLTGVWCGCGVDVDCSSGTPANPDTACAPCPPPAAGAPQRKIAAIGIHVSRGITSHGFAFNVTTDLRDFSLINPCGITDKPVTSLEREVLRTAASSAPFPSLEAVAHEAARQFGMVFAEQVLAVESLEALRRQAANAQIPALDTPLRVPAEVARLHGDPEPPQRA